ncbi:MAG: polysaccharide biosynthesis protein [bacterium F083]|nr:MAG: polysaccharide biosynthesis protein [bacterium F083]
MIKEFFKNVSIYGILPVVGKFLNFLLIPLYAKVFAPEEFGIIELLDTLIFFLLIIASFEIPTALGRYYYDDKDIKYKSEIISTGLFLTIIITLVICAISCFFENTILLYYVGNTDSYILYRLSLLWLALMSINTYLSFIPRYDNRPKLYVIVGIISNTIKLISSLGFVVILDLGLPGVFYGYICGNTVSIIMYYFLSKRYIRLVFCFKYSNKILNYVIPLLPGVLIAGLWLPLLRWYAMLWFPLFVIGYYGFTSRLTSVNSIVHGAFGIAWTPMMFEKKNEIIVGDRIRQISGLVFIFSAFIGIILSLFSPELTLIIGSEKYVGCIRLVPFVAFAGTIKVLTQLRGFGPYISDKTQYISIIQVVSVIVCSLIFFTFKDLYGLYGLGLIAVLYELLNYLLCLFYTKKMYHVRLYYIWELVFILFFITSSVCIHFQSSLILRSLASLILFITTGIIVYRTYRKHISNFLRTCNLN